MNKLINKSFDGNNVRTVKIENNVWFVASDVSKSLGYARTTNAIRLYVSDKNVIYLKRRDYGNTAVKGLWESKNDFRDKRIISQSGIYELLDHSQSEQAKRFNYWVNNTVLPSINDNGVYATDSALDDWVDNPEHLIEVLLKYKEKRDENEKIKKQLSITQEKNKKMKPKEIYYDDIGTNKGTIYVGDEAKALQKCGVKTGANRFFKWLRDNHYLGCKHGSSWNVPTQYAINLGVLTFVPVPTTLRNGVEFIAKTPLVTGKGQHYFYRKLAKKDGDK